MGSDICLKCCDRQLVDQGGLSRNDLFPANVNFRQAVLPRGNAACLR
jgi:hypothetical protein